jgi:glycine/D-amino acid oxidase-like deaminating enzyme
LVTTRRDLRTGHPIWAGRRAPSVVHEPLARDIKTDVLVIGAGITGAMVADALITADVKVAVVDRRGLANGSTAASTALVQYEIDTPLIQLTRKIGKDNAIRAWRRSRLAVAALAARFEQLKLADVARRSSLYLAGNILDRRELEREHEARRAAGLPSRFLDRETLRDEFRVARTAALVSHGNLVIDPRKATLALLQAAAAKGASLFAPTDIVNVAPQRGGVIATADNGSRIRCRHLVFGTIWLAHPLSCARSNGSLCNRQIDKIS